MKTSCVTNVLKKLIFPLAAGCCLLTGASVWAQGHIIRIYSAEYADKIVTADTGESSLDFLDRGIDLRIWLYNVDGHFAPRYDGNPAVLNPDVAWIINPFSIKVITGQGTFSWANLRRVINLGVADGAFDYTTELVFRYRVQPGDLALPLRLAGDMGAFVPGDPLNIQKGQWSIINTNGASTVDAVFRYMAPSSGPLVDPLDPTFERQNVQIQTLDFSESDPLSYVVQKTKTVVATISSDSPIASGVSLYVWSGNTNIVTISGTNSAGQITMAAGASEKTFTIHGVEEGETDVYFSSTKLSGPPWNPTNYISRKVTVIPAPKPTVSVTVPGKMNATDTYATVWESDSDLVPVTVTLSEPYPSSPASAVTVRLDMTPAGQSNIVLSSSTVTIEPGTLSGTTYLTAVDGTSTSGKPLGSIAITPWIDDVAHSNHFIRRELVSVIVSNNVPVVNLPVSSTVPRKVMKLSSADFEWDVSDVLADMSGTNMMVTWTWGDMTSTNLTGSAGTVSHMWNRADTYTVIFDAKDKDSGRSASVEFLVEVMEGTPAWTIRPVPNALSYDEATATVNGTVYFMLSDAYNTDMDVWLEVAYPDPAVSNITFETFGPVTVSRGETNSTSLEFQIVDGTRKSQLNNLILRPVLQAPAANTYEIRTTPIKINNTPPQITRVMGQAVGSTNPVIVVSEIASLFTAQIKDIDADLDTAWVCFDFGDGAVVSNQVVRSGGGYAVGTVSHAFVSTGVNSFEQNTWPSYSVEVWAQDKDGGVSARESFTVLVGPPPSVRVVPPNNNPLQERTVGAEKIRVELSSAFTQAVTVVLAITPPNGETNPALAGTLALDTLTVLFPPGQIGKRVEQEISISDVRDGTSLSRSQGFTITPSVSATPAAQAFYNNGVMQSTKIRVENEAPIIRSPIDMPITGTDYAYVVPQGTPYPFHWNITDVAADVNNNLTLDWICGDASKTIVNARQTGSTDLTFNSVGPIRIVLRVTDKDGGTDEVGFRINVEPVKKVNVTPIGPVAAGKYATALGRGNGLVFSDEARSRVIEGDVYSFTYDPSEKDATLRAVPYKTGANGTYTLTNYTDKVQGLPGVAPALGKPAGTSIYDSFVYVWTGGGQEGNLSANEDPLFPIAASVVSLTLPQAGGTGGGSGGNSSQVGVVFSREYLEADNRGDINLDGIPDIVAIRYKLPELLGGDDLADASGYNEDEGIGDFLPGAASTGNALISGMTNVFAAVGGKFTAFLETRGFNEGLNDFEVGRTADGDWTDGPLDEPGATKEKGGGTDPTRIDTDGDGYPDGWEYYFWYNATVLDQEGVRYNPANIAQGLPIATKDITRAFDPLVRSNIAGEDDIDNDGLTNLEELTIGTNPVHWDTDGDGICDGWEVLRGLDPNRRDSSGNPDGDYMAYAEVQRLFVTVNNAGVINTYLAKGEADAPRDFTRLYRYGDDNAPTAVGRPVSEDVVFENRGIVVGTPVVTNVVLIHNQVYQEFGFDPRVAWGETVNTLSHPDRFPRWVAGLTAETILTSPHTKRFTSLDEYLVLKYMSELGLNGAPKEMGVNNAQKIDDWLAYSTHPKTPDSDVEWDSPAPQLGNPLQYIPFPTGNTVIKTDRMPDGWELYVSSPKGYLERGIMVISPWNAYDGDVDIVMTINGDDEKESLSNMREFHGTDCSTFYTNQVNYAMTEERKGIVTILRPDVDAGWINKFWPTDPYNPDTDGDGVNDLAERTFLYGDGGAALAVDNGTSCTPGGGLNPNAMDTDLDALPDAWEVAFSFLPPRDQEDQTLVDDDEALFGSLSVTNGMDGTVKDAEQDYDNDGLPNYKEYWVQAVRSFRYDIPTNDWVAADSLTEMALTGLPMDMTFVPEKLFTEVANGVRRESDGWTVNDVSEGWDHSRYPWGDDKPVLWVMLPVGNEKLYVSTDPRNPDSDFDGMDDFYEMFHGLNPILGDTARPSYAGDLVAKAYKGRIDYLYNDWSERIPGVPLLASTVVPLLMDFVNYPWLTGLDEADPDADGLRNMEEHLQPDTAAPSTYNTDPSPLWLTDISSTNSVTARFYNPSGGLRMGTLMNFWPGDGEIYLGDSPSLYSFEMNEGYDTDNDGVSDKDELLLTATSQSDPQDHDDPMRRQALWFSGVNSAAQSLPQRVQNSDSLRSFTVELWFCPENLPQNGVPLAREQVLIERVLEYLPSDLSTPTSVVRANFRIGIDKQGCVFGLFQNAGVHDDHTGKSVVRSMPGRLSPSKWTHVILKMDGITQTLELWLDGQIETSADTALIPANGIYNFLQNPGSSQYPDGYSLTYTSGLIVLGASNVVTPFPGAGLDETVAWSLYSDFFTGYIDEVRIWDAARSNQQLLENYQKRFTRNDLLANRAAVRKSAAAGGLRVAGYSPQLPAELLYHYTFDNLFGSDRASTVAKVPRGFNHNDCVTNRPVNYVVDWWAARPTKSTVYNDYGYVPWIENGVEHLPLDGFESVGTNRVYREMFSVLNSRYWTHYSAGGGMSNPLAMIPSSHGLEMFRFPNSNNPYGHWYCSAFDRGGAGTSSSRGELFVGDLLPLGGAFAKQSAVMWDVDAPGSVWADTGEDSDSDGLPDWWELLRGTSLTSGEGNHGWYGDINGDGVSNGEQYLRDIANGWRYGDTTVPTGLKQTADVDQDGLPDWWENIYNLRIEVELSSEAATASINGAMGDPDRDGLNNQAEYLISEYYTTFGKSLSPRKIKSTAAQTMSDYFLKQGSVYLGEIFTDHDFMEYSWELMYSPYVNPFVYDAHLDPDQDGWSNWSESRYGASDRRSDPSLVQEYPIPVIKAEFSYHGERLFGNLVVHAFAEPSMNGNPDAIFTLAQSADNQSAEKTKNLGLWGPKKVSGVLSPGSVVPTTIRMSFEDQTPSPDVMSGGLSWPAASRTVPTVVTDVDNPQQAGRIGSLQARNAAGQTTVIGTVNYLTGEYTMDLALLEGWTLQNRMSDQSGVWIQPEVQADGSYITAYYVATQIMGWPKTLYLSDADVPTAANQSLGHVKEGVNYFFAFIDLNSNNRWDAGEPCAVDSTFGVDIGYDRNTVMFELTDYTPGYLRMALTGQRSEDVYFGTGGGTGGGSGGGGQATGSASANWVVVDRVGIDGTPAGRKEGILVKSIRSPRTSLHEGDLLENGQLALDWGFEEVPPTPFAGLISASYDVYVGKSTNVADLVLVTSFTNTYARTTRAQPVTVSPINGGYVYSARPTFKWQMPKVGDVFDDAYPAFVLEMRKDSASGELAYRSDPFKAPVRDITGVYSWEAPIYANSKLPNTGGLTTDRFFNSNKVYAWRVIALNSKYTGTDATDTAWSAWKLFRLDVNQERGTSGGFGAIQTRVKYYGPASDAEKLAGLVKVQAFNNAAFSGTPVAEYTLAGSDVSALTSLNAPVVNGLLGGLPEDNVVGDYYVMAFIDQNRNGKRDSWESWGYVNYYGVNDKAYDPRPTGVAHAAPPKVVDIVIEDADTDQDWFPDAWEWQEAERSSYNMADFLERVGPASGDRSDEEINPDLTLAGRTFMAPFMDMGLSTTDSDGDGLDDRNELLLGSDALNASTSGDGYSDGDKYVLGLNPLDKLTLRMTGVDVSSGMIPEIDWSISVKRTGVSLNDKTSGEIWIGFEVVYAQDLSTPISQWQVVRRGKVNQNGVQENVTEVNALSIDPASGFFRVRLVP